MQTRKDDSAFPSSYDEPIDENCYLKTAGLTKREYFAGIALQGLLSADKYLLHSVPTKAVQIADDLIKALNESNEL